MPNASALTPRPSDEKSSSPVKRHMPHPAMNRCSTATTLMVCASGSTKPIQLNG